MKVYVLIREAYSDTEVIDVYTDPEFIKQTYPAETWEEGINGDYRRYWSNGHHLSGNALMIEEFDVRDKPKSTA